MEVLLTHECTSFFHLFFCQFNNISTRFHCGHGCHPDIKKIHLCRLCWQWSETVKLDLAGTWEFLSCRVDVLMAKSPPCVVPVRTAGINEEEGRDPAQGGQTYSIQLVKE
ncbi:hypothetical protein ATANTOWER_002810 [Ataeniobius toweri]|uniref:Uncharacterized protein n=1 Tax=Ataeniobius toweri TaxID=208326 RepID=A0ABU7CAX6_9TELE|nr:hypothetical protein [Ataeniobius toweri]